MIELLFKKNYLAMIENAAKDQNWMFKNFYIVKDDKEVDALENGSLSCSTFASSILYFFNSVLEFQKKPKWLAYTHANVTSTEKDMLEHGWYEVQELMPGAVLFWEKQEHEHMGFCITETEAISNRLQNGEWFPGRHDITYNGTRKIRKILWHPELDKG